MAEAKENGTFAVKEVETKEEAPAVEAAEEPAVEEAAAE